MSKENLNAELSSADKKALFAAFPDLKELFPSDVPGNDIVKYMEKVAEECGVKHGAGQVLEFAAVAASAKLRAKIALGELQEADLAYGDDAEKQVIMSAAQTFRPSEKSPEVNRSLCQDIRDMNFNAAISLLPLQEELCFQFDQALPTRGRELIRDENSYRLFSLTSIGGNETAGGNKFKADEFRKTIGRRLVSDSIEKGDDNDIFKSFAALHLLSNSLQIRACNSLSQAFPDLVPKICREMQFFLKHAVPALAVSDGCREGEIGINNISQMKDIVSKKETKEYAYGTYASVLDMYLSSADVKSGRCDISRNNNDKRALPEKLPENQKTTNFINRLNFAVGNNLTNFKEKMRGRA